MIESDPLAAEPFSFQATKSGLVRIAFKGQVVTTLASRKAVRFLQQVEGASARDCQLAMARATGHFKHGNEREPEQARKR